MASRMKKIFHRKKNEDPEELRGHTRTSAAARSDPAMRTSLYESTTAGGLPQTGDYPIKGNDSSVVLQSGRKSSIRSLRSRRSSSRGSQHNTPLRDPTLTQYDMPPSNICSHPQEFNATATGTYVAHPSSGIPAQTQDDQRRRWSRSALPQEFAKMHIGDSQSSTTVTQTVTTTRTGNQCQHGGNGTPQTQNNPDQNHTSSARLPHPDVLPQAYVSKGTGIAQGYGARSKHAPRPEGQLDGQQLPTSRSYRDSAPGVSTIDTQRAVSKYDDHDQALERQKSIPRKQIGTSPQVQQQSRQSPIVSSTQTVHARQQSMVKPLPSIPAPSNGKSKSREIEYVSQPASMLDRSRPMTRGHAEPRNAQDVVSRAKSNTYDTEVIEKVAPAVVHENISKDIHHVREEVITREVHTHDVFHRILPVVDVEVLPPRHFLPVEGGGLVEVSASEVPGRGKNWVIAETASKIASDQAAPHGTRRFTARRFSGQEGDTLGYVTPEGHEKTEQTWVHPPELGEGARLTGQSWPMIFPDKRPSNETSSQSNLKSAKTTSPAKERGYQGQPPHKGGQFVRSVQQLWGR